MKLNYYIKVMDKIEELPPTIFTPLKSPSSEYDKTLKPLKPIEKKKYLDELYTKEWKDSYLRG